MSKKSRKPNKDKKNKFIDFSEKNLMGNLPGIWINNNSNNVDIENDLRLLNETEKKDKKVTPISDTGNIQAAETNSNFHFLNSNNESQDSFKFGNLDVSNDIRHGTNTRLDNNKFRRNKEKIVDNRFDFLDRNFQNPNNIVLPFARGGENTRVKKTDIEDKPTKLVKKENIKFNY